jgi:hypothetical protein
MISAQGPVAVLMAECELEADRELRLVRERNARFEARYAEVREAAEACDGDSWRIAVRLKMVPSSARGWLLASGCEYQRGKTPRWVIKKS